MSRGEVGGPSEAEVLPAGSPELHSRRPEKSRFHDRHHHENPETSALSELIGRAKDVDDEGKKSLGSLGLQCLLPQNLRPCCPSAFEPRASRPRHLAASPSAANMLLAVAVRELLVLRPVGMEYGYTRAPTMADRESPRSSSFSATSSTHFAIRASAPTSMHILRR